MGKRAGAFRAAWQLGYQRKTAGSLLNRQDDSRPNRIGVADLARRAEIGQTANERYFIGLAAVDTTTPLADLVQPVCQPVPLWERRSVRALHPMPVQDAQLLKAASRGVFIMQGFRNRDLRAPLFRTFARSCSGPSRARVQDSRIARRFQKPNCQCDSHDPYAATTRRRLPPLPLLEAKVSCFAPRLALDAKVSCFVTWLEPKIKGVLFCRASVKSILPNIC